MNNSYSKYFTLFSLYIAQSIPMSFFSTVVPVIMRQENYSLESIGMLQLLKLPWIIKFLWAPVVDKTSKRNIANYTKWIVSSEIFYGVIILFIGLLSLQTSFALIIFLMFFAFVASATQDIATDALAIFLLKKKERSLGNSIQSLGSFLGALMGTGVLLLIYNYFGWKALFSGLSAFVLIALIPLLFFNSKKNNNNFEDEVDEIDEEGKFEENENVDINKKVFSFFKQQEIYKQVLFLVLSYSSFIGLLTMLKPFLVDLGYNIAQIGFMSGIVGTGTAAICSFSSGYLSKLFGIKNILVFISFIILCVPTYFYLLGNILPINDTSIYIGIILLWGIYGGFTVIVFTTSMNCSRKEWGGTDFTMQIVITHLVSLVMAVTSGKIAGTYSYNQLFLVEMIIALITFIYIKFIYTKSKFVL